MSDTLNETVTMSWREANARRLARHGLAEPTRFGTPTDVTSAICGAHAQIMTAAETSIALRTADLTRDDVRHALWTERTLVKTYGPRGTVHLLPAGEVGMWCGALGAIPRPTNSFPERVRLTAEQEEIVVTVIGESLRDAELTIDELSEAVISKVGAWAGDLVMPAFNGMWPRWRQAITIAAHRGALCFGPSRGRKGTYTHPARWSPGFRPQRADDALAEVVRHYLHSYGPATPAHFARWISAPVRWATQLFQRLEGSIERVRLDGEPAWMNAGDTEQVTTSTTPDVRLLPYFDAFVVGSHPRERLFPGRAYERALANGQAGNYPVVLIDGVVGGVWHQRRSGRWLDITVDPLTELTTGQRRSVNHQVERIGAILDGKPRLSIGPITIGPHA